MVSPFVYSSIIYSVSLHPKVPFYLERNCYLISGKSSKIFYSHTSTLVSMFPIEVLLLVLLSL